PPRGAPGKGADLLDGRRHGALGAGRTVAPSLQLFQAALRAGDEPADRPSPGAAGDVAAELSRAAGAATLDRSGRRTTGAARFIRPLSPRTRGSPRAGYPLCVERFGCDLRH